MVEEKKPEETSFADLFEANPFTPQEDFRLGDTVTGEVVSISKENFFVSLGGKSEGVVDAAEFLDDEGNLTVELGDRLELKVSSVSDVICLSKGLKIKGANALEILREAFQSALPVEGRVDAVNKGGLEVDISGTRAFCPISQIDMGFCERPEEHIGQRYTFRIQEFKERGRNIIVSRRVLLEEEREKVAQETLAKLEPGQKVTGQVTRLTKFGAFVDIGGIDGMLHVSEMSHYRINNPSDFLKTGQTVQVLVTKCEPSAEGRLRISLSMKALEPTPWEKGLEIHEGQIITGKVSRIADFGAFVEVAPGIDGLVHISEISYERIHHPSKVLQEGQEVNVRILEINHDKQRISLSLKEAQAAQSIEAEGMDKGSGILKLEKGVKLEGIVENVISSGLFLRLPAAGPGVRGYLPQQELQQQEKADLKKKFPLGKKISVEVLAIEKDGKIRLSQKAASDREERKSFNKYMNQEDNSGKMATFGDLFKDLKLPPDKS